MRNKPFKIADLWMPCIENIIAVVIFVLGACILWFFTTKFPIFTSFFYGVLPVFRINIIDNIFRLFLSLDTNILLAIHAGIGAITFSVAVIIANSLIGDKKNVRDIGRTLIRESYFFALLVYEIIVFLLFLITPFSCITLNSVFVLTSGIFALFTLTQTLFLLMNRNLLEEKERKFRNRMINDSIKSLKYTKNICKQYTADITRELNHNNISTDIQNISYSKYEEPLYLTVSPYQIIRKIKYPLLILADNNTGHQADETSSITNLPQQKYPQPIVCIEGVNDSDNLASSRLLPIWIPKGMNLTIKPSVENFFELENIYNPDKEILEEELTSLAFKIQDSIKTSSSEKRVVALITNFHDLFETAAKENQIAPIKAFVDTSNNIILKLIDNVHTYAEIENFINLFFLPSTFLGTLIHKESTISKKEDLEDIDELIIRIYGQYLGYYNLTLEKSYNIHPRVKFIIKDRTWRIPKEKYQFQRKKSEKFALLTARYFSNLLFDTIEDKNLDDLQDWAYFFDKYKSLLSKESIHALEEPENIFYIPLFGLYSWCKMQKNDKEPKYTEVMRDIASFLKVLEAKNLTQIYIKSRNLTEYFGWEDKELSMHEDDGSPNMTEITIGNYIQSTYTEFVQELIENESNVSGLVNQIIEDLGNNYVEIRNLNILFQQQYRNSTKEKVKEFIKLFDEKTTYFEENEIINRDIDPEQIETFKKETILEFKRLAVLRKLLENENKINYNKVNINGKSSLGNSVFLDKDSFFKEWPVQYIDRDEIFSEALAKAENFSILKTIKASHNLNLIRKDQIEEALQDIKDPIIVTNLIDIGILESLLGKITDYQESIYGIPGYKLQSSTGRIIPIIDVWGLEERNTVYLLEKNCIGEIIQRKPNLKNLDIEQLTSENYIHVGISEYNANLDETQQNSRIKETLSTPPEFLSEKAKDERIRYLQTHVLADVYESFEFKLDSHFKGYLLTISEDEV